MRKVTSDIGAVRTRVNKLVGQALSIRLSPGRNKITMHEGKIAELYPSLFTLDVGEGDSRRKITCSYSDVLCGKVSLSKLS